MRQLQGFFANFEFTWQRGLFGDLGFYEHKTLFELGNKNIGARAYATSDNKAYAQLPWEGPVAFGVQVLNEAVANGGSETGASLIRLKLSYNAGTASEASNGFTSDSAPDKRGSHFKLCSNKPLTT